MLAIDLIVSASQARRWQHVLLERLDAAGYDVAVIALPVGDSWSPLMSGILGLERRLLRRADGLASPAPAITARPRGRAAPIAIDLIGGQRAPIPTLAISFDGNPSDAALVSMVAAGHLPDVEIRLDGKPVERGSPMIDHREFTALGADDVFARAITLLLKTIGRLDHGESFEPVQAVSHPVRSDRFLAPFLTSSLPRLGREVMRRGRYQYAHWSVGYRLIDGDGVVETAALRKGWSVLPDDGKRFLADPFPFEHAGQHFIFVEDYPYSTKKAVISVSVLDADGVASSPVPVLEEPFHLSYPQVFADGDAIWMLPEASASGKLTLYRAERFPDHWEPEVVLLEGEISDATLLRHDGRYWLFATDRDGHGSTSDTMVVFHASVLTGPWTPHRDNPIIVDRRRARPGGSFTRVGNRLVLPVQDGTLGYGGGLGLLDILDLDENRVGLGPYRPIDTAGDWPHPQVHTLNRAGRLEVIDGIAPERKRRQDTSRRS